MTDKEIQKNVADNLWELLHKGDKSIGQIVRESGITRHAFDNYCNEKCMPNLVNAYRIIQYFNITFDDLVGSPKETEREIRTTSGLPKSVFRQFANLPYEKKKVVVDIIDVLSKKG